MKSHLQIKNNILWHNPNQNIDLHDGAVHIWFGGLSDDINCSGLFELLDLRGKNRLENFLKDKLPDYMLPSPYIFVDALPLMENGKLNRSDLPVIYMEDENLTSDHETPRDYTEKVLAEVWSKTLGEGKLSIYDNFFELGGHSLLTIQIIARVKEAFKVDISISTLFWGATIAGLAILIKELTQKNDNFHTPLTRAARRKASRIHQLGK